MEKTTKVSVNIAGRDIDFEAGLLAQQANGSLTVTTGDTVLFCSACASKKPREGIDWFPLQIEYREKFYAAGRSPGGFFKREARPAEKEILTARVTDRPLRPLFPEGYCNEVQIMITLLSTDIQNPHQPADGLFHEVGHVFTNFLGQFCIVNRERAKGADTPSKTALLGSKCEKPLKLR